MRIVKTHELTPERLESLSQTDTLWCYNGLDCMVTDEIVEVFLGSMDDYAKRTYAFSRELMGPVLEMNMRGVLVDIEARDRAVIEFEKDIDRLKHNLNRLIIEGVGLPGGISPTAPIQVGKLFYDVMKLPEVKKRNAKGLYVRTTDEDALNSLSDYLLARQLVGHILLIRSLSKRVSTLITSIDPDGRMRTNFNIGGTNTGRLASSLGDFESGGNMQNWEDRLRRIFVPDPGMMFGNIDLAQADARNVGAIIWNLFNDSVYLDACESGDLHTSVARMCWPGLPWTDDAAYNKKVVAEQKFYRHLSYRDSSKKLGHGTNYRLTPRSAQKKTHIPSIIVEGFQNAYFRAFPRIPNWHEWCEQQVDGLGYIITPHFGRRRHFFGRKKDDSTYREAIAFAPQSMTADEIDTALVQLWRTGKVQLLLQIHDALFFQFPIEQVDEIMPAALAACKVSMPLLRDREFTVPPDAQVGMNWGKVKRLSDGSVENELGLDAWKG